MSLDIHKGIPYAMLEDTYDPKDGEGIQQGMMVKLDPATNKLVKAVGGVDEYPMVAATSQSTNWIENGNKVQVYKENCSLWTSFYKVGPGYTPHCKLQVSTAGGEEGRLTIHAGAGAPIVGRFQRIGIPNTTIGETMMLFDLVRS